MPAEQWAKLHAKLAESVDFADLYEASPEAALLFLMSLPQAVPWGVLPGDPRLFGRRVCGMLGLSAKQVETSLRLIVDSGMYRSYTDEEGRPLLYVTHWNENQQRQWGRCGLPEFKLPPDWTPPEGISDELATAKAKGRGLTAEALAECVVLDSSETQSKTGLSLSLANGYLKRSRDVEKLEVRLRQRLSAPPANADDAAPADDDEGTLPQPASVPQEPDPEGKPRKPRQKQDPEAVAAALADLREEFDETALAEVDAFMGMARGKRLRGVMAENVELTLTRDLLKLRRETGMTSEAFAFGIAAALRKGADNVNYAATAARGYAPPATGSATRLPFHATHTQAPSRPDTFVGGKVKV